jgi:hydroxymethylpyrimidine pyrophosphatase-like HAD family hydrolase
LCDEARDAILAADLVILSSGTQWSSLIPTYASTGFADTMREFAGLGGKVLMVMNRQPDKDSPGQTATDIIDILVPKYFQPQQLHVIVDSSGSPMMNELSGAAGWNVASLNSFDLRTGCVGTRFNTIHSSEKLAKAIGATYFSEYLDSDHYMFDYDDTLIGRGNKFPLASDFNAHTIGLIHERKNVSICTGNSIKAVRIKDVGGKIDPISFEIVNTPLTVFADGGVNKYLYNTQTENSYHPDDGEATRFVECVNPEVLLTGYFKSEKIIDALVENGIPLSKIENRGDAIISIKPIDNEYRQIVKNMIENILSSDAYGGVLQVKITGRTTVEIHHPNLSKRDALVHVVASENISKITYVGDELDSGNDSDVGQLAFIKRPNAQGLCTVGCLKVTNPVKTAFFLLTLKQSILELK